jgi:hypothetical protein
MPFKVMLEESAAGAELGQIGVVDDSSTTGFNVTRRSDVS